MYHSPATFVSEHTPVRRTMLLAYHTRRVFIQLTVGLFIGNSYHIAVRRTLADAGFAKGGPWRARGARAYIRGSGGPSGVPPLMGSWG